MYKRRALVVFLAADSNVAWLVVRHADQVASEWIQAAVFEPTILTYDLLVTLDEISASPLPCLPDYARHKHWPLGLQPSSTDVAVLIQSLVGGMRLLAALDASAPPS